MVKGQLKTITPGKIHEKYLSIVPLLPNDANSWGFNLLSVFHGALPENIRKKMLNNGYRLPPFTTLGTKTSQMIELHKLCTAADKAHGAILQSEKSL